MVLTEEVRALLREYAGADPAAVALLGSRQPGRPFAFVAQQLKGREKARRKLPSWHGNPEVVYGSGLSLEQCSSEAVARFRAGLVEGFARGMDLTGGFGVDSRFLAEKGERLLYCERDAGLAAVAEHNFRVFGLGDRVAVEVGDGVAAFAREAATGLDFVFVDPARRDARSYKVSAFEDCEPDIAALWERVCAASRVVMVKASPGLDVSAGLGQLPGTSAVYVVAVEGECKELLFEARRGEAGEAEVCCVDLRESGAVDTLRFRLSEETALAAAVGKPERYLYEPNGAIMKGGAFKTVSARFGVKALHARTRLYTSSERVEGFPGRVFEILGQGALNAKMAKKLFPDGRANVVSRNSGMSADELRRKLGLKDGGEAYAVGASVEGWGRALFACRLAMG